MPKVDLIYWLVTILRWVLSNKAFSCAILVALSKMAKGTNNTIDDEFLIEAAKRLGCGADIIPINTNL